MLIIKKDWLESKVKDGIQLSGSEFNSFQCKAVNGYDNDLFFIFFQDYKNGKV